MKKLTTVLIILIIAAALTSCGSEFYEPGAEILPSDFDDENETEEPVELDSDEFFEPPRR